MSAPGRPKALDDSKQASVCSLVAAGVSLRQVAFFVGCDPQSIRREAQRNDRFRAELARAKSEARIHPLVVLRRAAKTDWRAALCWMERVDPERFARRDASVVTKREANQFVRHLIESIERAVSDPREREDLFQLVAAAMPVAMRTRWDGSQARRSLQQAIRDFHDRKCEEEQRTRATMLERNRVRGQFFLEVERHLPNDLRDKLGRYWDLLAPDDTPPLETGASARRTPQGPALHDNTPPNDAPTNPGPADDPSPRRDPTRVDPTSKGPTNNASPRNDCVALPRRNPARFAPPTSAKLGPASDLPPPDEANPLR